jgi:uncharacterized protein (TIRG00374 family)
MKKKYKTISINALKIILSIVPFIWISTKLDINKLWPAVLAVNWITIPLLFLAVFGFMFLQGLRWWILLRAFSNDLPFMRTMSYHFSSLFYSLILPNSTAQEIVRTLYITKHAGPVISWSAAWICKITALIISFGLSIYGLIILSGSGISGNLMLGSGILFLLISLLVLLSFSKKITKPLGIQLKRIIPLKYQSKLEKLREGIYQFRYKKKAIFLSLCCTLLSQILLISAAMFLIKGITNTFFIAECFAFIPLIEIISMAQPFTPNGIGVRDALIALMFKHLGLTTEQLGVYIIISNLTILVKLTGAAPVLHGIVKARRLKKAQPQQAPDIQ